MHYAVPKILNSIGALQGLYTDLYISPIVRRIASSLAFGPQQDALRRIAGRSDAEIPADKVVSFPALGIAYALRRRLASASSSGRVYVDYARKFTARALESSPRWGDAVYCFNGAGLEILHEARRRGLYAFTEQTIAPLSKELELIELERSKHPAWEGLPGKAEPAVLDRIAREEEEWELAKTILCGSSFVLGSLPPRVAGKGKVIPYGVELSHRAKLRTPHKPLRVLTVGVVGLRKGSPYVIEAARRLGNLASFRLVGTVGSRAAQRDVPFNLQLVGPVPRQLVQEHYDWADVFLLPSICEGSATVTYEAFSLGLPVVCTPNAGSLVEDGITGLVIPPGEVEPVIQAIDMLARDPSLLERLSSGVLAARANVGLEAYAGRLSGALFEGMS
jgi:glycosyltransferase involved in cell wall biosynthesis